MPINFSDPGHISRNGSKSLSNSEHAIYSGVNRDYIINHKASSQRMEAILIQLITWGGITTYIGAIILNAGNWKSDVLWFLALMFGVVKFIRYSMKTWQDFRKGEIEIKAQQKKIK